MCRQVVSDEVGPLLTTWPAFAEAMYLLGDAAGWPAQRALWEMTARGALEIADLGRDLVDRARALMEKYRDVPMDLADATLVAVAEERGLKRVFTLDSDFDVYRLRGRASFEIIPSTEHRRV